MMLLYTGSFFLCWIIPVIIVMTPLNNMPAFKMVMDVLFPLQCGEMPV